MRNLSLIKTIIRNLRFIELPELIGQQITIQDIDSIEATLRKSLGTWVIDTDPFKFAGKIELSLAKYDLIDVKFLVPGERFDWGEQNSMELLKSWRFFQRAPDTSEPDDIFTARDFLEEFVEEVTSGEMYLRIMLRAEKQPNQTPSLKIPADYFPRTFAVKAACVSNGTFMWYALNHFYL